MITNCKSKFTHLFIIYHYLAAWAWITTLCRVSPAPSHVLNLKKEQKLKEVESPLCLKKERLWEDWVGETNIRNKEEKERKERMCVGVEDESSGMGITETLVWWLMVFVEVEIHLGAFFPWHCETTAGDDSAECLCALTIFWLVYTVCMYIATEHVPLALIKWLIDLKKNFFHHLHLIWMYILLLIYSSTHFVCYHASKISGWEGCKACFLNIYKWNIQNSWNTHYTVYTYVSKPATNYSYNYIILSLYTLTTPI